MDRGLYQKQWGTGNAAVQKKLLKSTGQLDKYGKPNDKTPKDWLKTYVDHTGPSTGPLVDPAALYSAETATLKTEAVPPPAKPVKVEATKDVAKDDDDSDAKDTKKRKHRDETAEEKAERKRLRKEKKEKKEKKREASDDN